MPQRCVLVDSCPFWSPLQEILPQWTSSLRIAESHRGQNNLKQFTFVQQIQNMPRSNVRHWMCLGMDCISRLRSDTIFPAWSFILHGIIERMIRQEKKNKAGL